MATKLCKDCKWAQQGASWQLWRCLHPENRRPEGNPVTGEPLTIWLFCEEMRGVLSPCGPDGKLFEANDG